MGDIALWIISSEIVDKENLVAVIHFFVTLYADGSALARLSWEQIKIWRLNQAIKMRKCLQAMGRKVR